MDEPALHLARSKILSQPDPLVMLPVPRVFKDGMEDKAFDIDVGAASAADDILELGDLNLLAVTIERMHNDYRCRKIEALSQCR